MPAKFENDVFTLKTHKVFSVHAEYIRGIIWKLNNHQSSWILCFRRTWAEKSLDRDLITFKRSIFKMYSIQTLQCKASVFKFHLFKECFRKAPFSWPISVGPTMERTLHLQCQCKWNTSMSMTPEIQHPRHIFIAGKLEVCSTFVKEVHWRCNSGVTIRSAAQSCYQCKIKLTGQAESLQSLFSCLVTTAICSFLQHLLLGLFWDYFMCKKGLCTQLIILPCFDQQINVNYRQNYFDKVHFKFSCTIYTAVERGSWEYYHNLLNNYDLPLKVTLIGTSSQFFSWKAKQLSITCTYTWKLPFALFFHLVEFQVHSLPIVYASNILNRMPYLSIEKTDGQSINFKCIKIMWSFVKKDTSITSLV